MVISNRERILRYVTPAKYSEPYKMEIIIFEAKNVMITPIIEIREINLLDFLNALISLFPFNRLNIGRRLLIPTAIIIEREIINEEEIE